MHWDLVLITALWWVFIGAILTAAIYMGIRRSVARTGWVRRTWIEWIQGLVLVVVVFAPVFVGIASDYGSRGLQMTPEAAEAASRLVGALIVVVSVYSYGFSAAAPSGCCLALSAASSEHLELRPGASRLRRSRGFDDEAEFSRLLKWGDQEIVTTATERR
jgi:hypothetical protein